MECSDNGDKRTLRAPGRFPPGYLVLVAVGLLLFLLFSHRLVDLPNTQFVADLKNSAHALLFFVLTGIIVLWLRQRDPARSLNAILLRAAAMAALLALLTEALQFVGPRDASVQDIGLDMAGTFAALLSFKAWQLWRAQQGSNALALAMLAALSLAVGFSPLAHTWWLYQQRDAAVPHLLHVSQGERYLRNNLQGHWQLAEAPAAWAAYREQTVVSVYLGADRLYPGISLFEPYPDWGGYDELVLDTWLEETNALPLTIRLRTERDGDFGPLLETEIPPGSGRVAIPLTRLLGPEGDRPRVRQLLLYSSSRQAGRRYLLGDVRLE